MSCRSSAVATSLCLRRQADASVPAVAALPGRRWRATNLPGPPESLHHCGTKTPQASGPDRVALRHCGLATLAHMVGEKWIPLSPFVSGTTRPIFLGVGTYPRSTLFPLPRGGVHAGRDLCPSVNRRQRSRPREPASRARAWCINSGHTVSHEYVEHESGRKGADRRKQFAALFDDAAKRKFDCVLFWALDRFSREGMAQTIAHLQCLVSYGVAFHSYTEPHLATDNELDRPRKGQRHQDRSPEARD